VTIGPGVNLLGSTVVGDGARIDAHSVLLDCEISTEAWVRALTHGEGARIGPESTVGPFARLRAKTELGRGVRIGNFVEIKNSRLDDGATVGHLTYLGDTQVGADSNIGAGTITCNYDGVHKHRTEIGANSFIGSNTSLIAPVTVGAGALVGAGSVIVEDVPEDSIAVSRATQVVRQGAASRYREKLLASRTPKTEPDR
jgi:bifunctional UDP-N-acetylglucosamine pyrophosphorylase/glucosamine-1-phosphate N-acetyltransferase